MTRLVPAAVAERWRALRRGWWFPLLALAWLGAGMSTAAAGDKVWAALYLAEDTKPAPGKKVAPEELRHRLHEIFGYKHYELVGGEMVDLHQDWPHWVMPRRDFFMRVQPLPRKDDDDPHVIYYEIYKDGFIVAKGKYEPHEDAPLFINGPDFRDGELVYVVQSREED